MSGYFFGKITSIFGNNSTPNYEPLPLMEPMNEMDEKGKSENPADGETEKGGKNKNVWKLNGEL